MSQVFNIIPLLHNTETPRCPDPNQCIPDTHITLKFTLTLFFYLPTGLSKVFPQYFLTKTIYVFLVCATCFVYIILLSTLISYIVRFCFLLTARKCSKVLSQGLNGLGFSGSITFIQYRGYE
jgi:hypothetical protein